MTWAKRLKRVFSIDIEAELINHEAVNDVAVTGMASKRWGETPIALVVPAPGTVLPADRLLQWANGLLGKQQRLADVIFVEELPRNPNGKILKRELRESFGDREYG